MARNTNPEYDEYAVFPTTRFPRTISVPRGTAPGEVARIYNEQRGYGGPVRVERVKSASEADYFGHPAVADYIAEERNFAYDKIPGGCVVRQTPTAAPRVTPESVTPTPTGVDTAAAEAFARAEADTERDDALTRARGAVSMFRSRIAALEKLGEEEIIVDVRAQLEAAEEQLARLEADETTAAERDAQGKHEANARYYRVDAARLQRAGEHEASARATALARAEDGKAAEARYAVETARAEAAYELAQQQAGEDDSA